MREQFDPDLDAIADGEDTAEFKRNLVGVNADHRRILQVLLPKLAALQERGDCAAALRLIAEIKRIVIGEEQPPH
ncbi:hypothetical protein [Caulobacter sp. FWC2]|uniref:hypothetical protein n=1 Tax=Caulobacter sp. FWC2 TaxID=69664 RepID=UPI000C156F2B|nr:hypothetical protein [Caulobacter sp. FWC2]PIB94347.1 hypothetical protein CSW62_23910 [Caulobacter sp. FWC2]